MNLDRIKKLKKDENIVLNYRTKLPQSYYDRMYANPSMNPKFKPENYSEKATFIRVTEKSLIVMIEGKRRTFLLDCLDTEGRIHLDSTYFVVLSTNLI